MVLIIEEWNYILLTRGCWLSCQFVNLNPPPLPNIRVLKAGKRALPIHVHPRQTHSSISLYTWKKYLLFTCAGHCCYSDTVMSKPSMTCAFVEPIVALVLICHCKGVFTKSDPLPSSYFQSALVSRDRLFIFCLHSGYNREKYMSWAQGFRPLSACLVFSVSCSWCSEATVFSCHSEWAPFSKVTYVSLPTQARFLRAVITASGGTRGPSASQF